MRGKPWETNRDRTRGKGQSRRNPQSLHIRFVRGDGQPIGKVQPDGTVVGPDGAVLGRMSVPNSAAGDGGAAPPGVSPTPPNGQAEEEDPIEKALMGVGSAIGGAVNGTVEGTKGLVTGTVEGTKGLVTGTVEGTKELVHDWQIHKPGTLKVLAL